MNEWVPDSIAPKRKNAIVRHLRDEFLVYDLETNRAHCLNQIAAKVWMLCDGKATVAEIAGKLGSDSESSVDETVIEVALSRLQNAGLMELGSSESEHVMPSRRAAMRKMAAAALALPVVASILVPTAAQAQSSGAKRPARRGTRPVP